MQKKGRNLYKITWEFAQKYYVVFRKLQEGQLDDKRRKKITSEAKIFWLTSELLVKKNGIKTWCYCIDRVYKPKSLVVRVGFQIHQAVISTCRPRHQTKNNYLSFYTYVLMSAAQEHPRPWRGCCVPSEQQSTELPSSGFSRLADVWQDGETRL